MENAHCRLYLRRGVLEPCLSWLCQNEDQRRKEQGKHHVRPAFLYFDREPKLKPGTFTLDAEPEDPVLGHLLQSMRWLATHPRLLSVGVYGQGNDLYSLCRSDDPMAALGNLYGLLLALAYPFLGPRPALRVLLSGRTEATGTADKRLPSSQTGGDRINIGFMQDNFWHSLEALKPDVEPPSGILPRQRALAAHSQPGEFERQLERENVAGLKTGMMKNLADLACGMMATLAPANRDRKIRFDLGRQPGPAMRFFTMEELAA
jgi:hypothetical protein